MKLPAYTKTFVLAAAVLLLALPRDGGAWLVLVVPALLACAAYALVRLAFKPAERRVRASQLGVWVAVLVAIALAQAYWSGARRDQADAVAAAVVAYKQRTGGYPASLTEAGLDEAALREHWGIRYRRIAAQPELAYPAQAMPLTSREYDFEARAWKLNAY